MAHTPDGMKRFARTIPTKRDGTCEYCQAATRSGVDYAGVNGEGKWTGVCATCAASITEQVKGVVRTLGEIGKGHDDLTVDTSMINTSDLTVVLHGEASEAAAYDMLLTLLSVRAALVTAIAQAAQAAKPVSPVREALHTIATTPNGKPGDRDFAASLVRWLDGGRDLTERQQAAADRMISRYQLTSQGTTAAPVAECENGLYLHDTGRIYKLYTTQNGYQGCKVLVVYGEGDHQHGSLEYVKGGTKVVRQAVADGFARILTQDEAAAFGRLHGFCCNCAIDIDDDRSLAAGYGPVCAKNHGWFYPTYAEAARMLGRPVTASNGKVYDPA